MWGSRPRQERRGHRRRRLPPERLVGKRALNPIFDYLPWRPLSRRRFSEDCRRSDRSGGRLRSGRLEGLVVSGGRCLPHAAPYCNMLARAVLRGSRTQAKPWANFSSLSFGDRQTATATYLDTRPSDHRDSPSARFFLNRQLRRRVSSAYRQAAPGEAPRALESPLVHHRAPSSASSTEAQPFGNQGVSLWIEDASVAWTLPAGALHLQRGDAARSLDVRRISARRAAASRIM